MRWPLRLLRSVPRALALGVLLLAALAALALLLLAGLAAYALSPEGRRLLGDLQKW